MSRTQRSFIKNNLRRMWLMSRERAEALKRDNYSCQKCGIKQSKKKGFEVKVQVHHKKGINVWDEVIDLIYKDILCETEDLQTLCKECHDDI